MSSTTWRDDTEFKEHARTWAGRLGVTPKRIQMQKMQRKWASCSPLGAVSFSEDLLAEPRSFGETVIVHELLHLKVRNHGPVFRSLLSVFLSGHEDLATVSCERPIRRKAKESAGT